MQVVWLLAVGTNRSCRQLLGIMVSSMKKTLSMAWHMWMYGSAHLMARTGAGCPLQPQATQAGTELPAHLDISHGIKAIHLIEQLQHGSLDLPLPT